MSWSDLKFIRELQNSQYNDEGKYTIKAPRTTVMNMYMQRQDIELEFQWKISLCHHLENSIVHLKMCYEHKPYLSNNWDY